MSESEFEEVLATGHPGNLKVRDLRNIQRELRRLKAAESEALKALLKLKHCSHPEGSTCNCHRKAHAVLKKAGLL